MVYSFNQFGSSSSEYWPDKSLHIFLCGMCNFLNFDFLNTHACANGFLLRLSQMMFRILKLTNM